MLTPRRLLFYGVVVFDLFLCVLFFEGVLQLISYLHREVGVSNIVSVDGLAVYEQNTDRFVRAEDDGASSLIHHKTNGEGYNDGEFRPEREADIIRVAAVGDSYTAALGVDFDTNFLTVLEKEVSKERPVEIMNFGVGGQGTVEEAVRYVKKVSHYDPAHVVLFVTADDIENNQYYASEKSRIEAGEWLAIPLSHAHNSVLRTDMKFWLLSTFRTIYELDELVRSNAALGRLAVLLGLQNEGIVSTEVRTVPPEFFVYEAPLSEEWKDVFSLTATILASFKEEVERQGAKLSLVYIPEVVQVDPERIKILTAEEPAYARVMWDFDQPNNFFRDVARDLDVPFFDLTPPLQAQYVREPYVSLFANGVGHQNQLGNTYMAEALVPFFETLIEE